MNTNYEAIRSLVELLVKKAGFDINKSYSEDELRKTKETISKFEKNNMLTSENKKRLISNLKLRLSNWENNAEVIGKSLLKCYKEKKSYNEVRGKIEYLAALAKKDDEKKDGDSSVGYVYDKIKELENSYEDVNKRIEEDNYSNFEEKDVDIKLKEYLTVRIEAYSEEIKLIDTELERLKDVESREEIIAEKLKKHIVNIKKDVEALEAIKKNSLEKSIAIEVWEKIETIELGIKEKLEKTSSVMKRTDKILEEVKVKRAELNEKRKKYESERDKNKSKLEDISARIENDDYLDYTRKVKDLNNQELIRLELEEFKNKKEVIYIDVDKVKDELIREWQKGESSDAIVKEEVKVKNEAKIDKVADESKVKEEPVKEESKESEPLIDKEEVTDDEVKEKEVTDKENEPTLEVEENVKIHENKEIEKQKVVETNEDKVEKLLEKETKVEAKEKPLENVKAKEIEIKKEEKQEEVKDKKRINKIELDW